MFPISRRIGSRCLIWLVLGLACGAFAPLPAAPAALSVESSSELLTGFEQIWEVAKKPQRIRHPVRLEYVVYYYDPLWQALWGRCGEADSYLSLGSREFPIAPRQRILIQGTMIPAEGMMVHDPQVSILQENVPVDVLPARGRLSSTELLNKRLIVLEGFVDDETMRDEHHLELRTITEGKVVLGQVLLRKAGSAPPYGGSHVRMTGVYFARPEGRAEVWVPDPASVEVLSPLERDRRFTLPVTPLREAAGLRSGAPVHLSGTVRAHRLGEFLTLSDTSGELTVPSLQSRPLEFGSRVDLVGTVAGEGDTWELRDVLYRVPPRVITDIDAIYLLPEAEAREPHRLRTEVLIYYYDPDWKVVWGKSGGSNAYYSFVDPQHTLRPGQRILLEGTVVPSRGATVEDVRVTILADNVPLPIVAANGRLTDPDTISKQPVQLEGIVDRQFRVDKTHVMLDLIVDDHAVAVRLQAEGDLPNWEGLVVRVSGVFSHTADPLRRAPRMELWTHSPEQIEIEGRFADDSRFLVPVTPIDQLAAVAPGQRIRLTGVVRGQQPGASLAVRDDTGQVTVDTIQQARLPLGTPVEVIGEPELAGGRWVVKRGLYRKLSTAAPVTKSDLPAIRLAEQLRDLTMEEAARKYPVHLAGIVTWFHPTSEFFYMQDASGGVYVLTPPDAEALAIGARVEVTGLSGAGAFTPLLMAHSLRRGGDLGLPEPRAITLEQALTGVEEANWVAMSGYVRDITADGQWTRLLLSTSAGEFQAILPASSDLDQLRGTVVRARGVCRAVTNGKHQLTGIELLVPEPRYVALEEPLPDDPFSVPLRTISSLRRFNPLQAVNRRVRVSGVVLNHSPGRFIRLQDGGDGLLVLSRETTPLQAGDRVEVVGFPSRETTRPVLREALYRKTGSGPEADPKPLADVRPIDVELDGRLVRVAGQLLDFSVQDHGAKLLLQGPAALFEAWLDIAPEQRPSDWKPGATLSVTGVYVTEFDEYKRAHSAHLELRSPRDVVVDARAPWWTVRRVLALTGVLGVAMVLGLVWVVALRRRVRQQTDVIREQLDKEKAARLEAALARASKLESLGILAGGIAHDFNNLLTVILCNLSLAQMDEGVGVETEQALREGERATARARELTQQLLTFAKGGAPVRVSTRLPELVRESAGFALHGSRVRCEFDIPDDLWPALIDKGQVARVVQNIVINANQAMTDGGVVFITMRNLALTGSAVPPLRAGRYLQLLIRDTGPGIPAEQLSRIFDPYFTTKPTGTGLGLATVYSIVQQHQGHVEVESAVGRGTVFTVYLPAAEEQPVDEPTPDVSLPRRSGRVLFMDDERSIRQLAGTVLRRMGLEVTEVADGAAVVREYTVARNEGRPFDLVILDLTVPGAMGGAEAMRELRKIDPGVRAIVSSGYSSDPVMGRYREHGFESVVAKPYEAMELARAVDRAL